MCRSNLLIQIIERRIIEIIEKTKQNTKWYYSMIAREFLFNCVLMTQPAYFGRWRRTYRAKYGVRNIFIRVTFSKQKGQKRKLQKKIPYFMNIINCFSIFCAFHLYMFVIKSWHFVPSWAALKKALIRSPTQYQQITFNVTLCRCRRSFSVSLLLTPD